MRMVPPHRGRGGHCCIDPQPVILTRDLPVRGASAEDPDCGSDALAGLGSLSCATDRRSCGQDCRASLNATVPPYGGSDHDVWTRGTQHRPNVVTLQYEHRPAPGWQSTPSCRPTFVANQRTSRRPGFGQRAPFEHRNVHMRPTKDLVDHMCAGQRPATGAPPGTRTPNPRIKRPKSTPSQYDYLQLHEPAEGRALTS